jgi:uncharacterized membrane protein YhdT
MQNKRTSTLYALVFMALAATSGTILLSLFDRSLEEQQFDMPSVWNIYEIVLLCLIPISYLSAAVIVWLYRSDSVVSNLPSWFGISCIGTFLLLVLNVIYKESWLGGSSFLTLNGLKVAVPVLLLLIVYNSAITFCARHIFAALQSRTKEKLL